MSCVKFIVEDMNHNLVPMPPPFFVLRFAFALPLLCIILNANRRTKNGGGLGTRLYMNHVKYDVQCVKPFVVSFVGLLILCYVRRAYYSYIYCIPEDGHFFKCFHQYFESILL